jgi:hypothetical protein
MFVKLARECLEVVMRSMLIGSFVLLSSMVAFGCSSSGASSPEAERNSSVDGAVSTAKLVSLRAVARNGKMFDGAGPNADGLRILISDKANTCSATHFASSTNLDLRIRGNAVGPGTYAIVNASARTPAVGEAEADLNAVDGACKDLVAQAAVTGTITLKTVVISIVGDGRSHVSGSVDATFGGGHIVGDFDADLCDDVPATVTDASAGSCTP